MICPKCGVEGIESGDVFCRHCGLSLATPTPTPEGRVSVVEKKAIAPTDGTPGKGLQLIGAALFLFVAVLVIAIAPIMGWVEFGASALPWFSGALMVAGLVLILVGAELRVTAH